MRNLNYKPRLLCNISTMTNEEWLKARMHGPHYDDPTHPYYVKTAIGGSDVSIVYNLNPYTTSLELYHKKIGVEPKIPKKMNDAALEAGHTFEPYVGKRFMDYMTEVEEAEIEYIEDFNMYQSGELEMEDGFPVINMETGEPVLKYPFAVANLDARCRVKEPSGWVDCGVELKTTNYRNYDIIRDWQNGIVPIYYELQCRYYMAITNINRWYICCCWGFRKEDCAVVRIDRDLVIEEEIMETVKEFVRNIEEKEEPDITECKATLFNDYYEHLYGIRSEHSSPIELDAEEYLEIFHQAEKLDLAISKKQQEVESLEKQKAEIFKQLLSVYKDKKVGKLETDDKVYYLTLEQSFKRASVDTERLKAENHALYTEYATTEVKEKFDTTKFKKKCPADYQKYLKPAELNVDKLPSFKLSVREKSEV